jgi:hypothetical protein
VKTHTFLILILLRPLPFNNRNVGFCNAQKERRDGREKIVAAHLMQKKKNRRWQQTEEISTCA